MIATTQNIVENMNKLVTIVVVSDVKLKGGKANPMQGHVTKSSLLEVRLLGNGEYDKMMKENVDSSFVSKPRAWGTRREDGLIEHKGELYVEVSIEDPIARVFFLDGDVIKMEDIEGYEDPEYTDDPVIVRTYKLKNVKAIIPGNDTSTEF